MAQITLLTGPERRRRWSDEERERILAAAFAPGAIVANISRQFEVSTSLIYKWREQALAAGQFGSAFAPAILAGEPMPVKAPEPEPEPAAILIELANGSRVKINPHASPEMVTAALRALR
jgi:transposase